MAKRGNGSVSAMIVAENIMGLRKKLGLPVQVAAERCHLAQEELMKLETGVGVFDSAITLLKVAEGYNVDYQRLYESKGKTDLLNAHVPADVYRGIRNLLKERSIKVREFCEMIGCHESAFYYWIGGHNNATVLMFSNIINLLQLKASDLEKMVRGTKTPEPVKDKPEQVPEVVVQKDPFEDRVLKIMRLQKNIGEYVKRLETIVGEVNKLRDELVMLQEQ